MSIEIAPAQAEDFGAITALLAAQFAEHDIELDGAGIEAAVRGVLDDPRRGLFLVARKAGHAVAMAYVSFTWALEHGGLSSWLEELYVVPAERERGLGTSLLRAALEAARRRGAAAVDLEVEASHTRAARLYAREGFRPHARARWVKKLA